MQGSIAVDPHLNLFFEDGEVNWELARQWIGAVHMALRSQLGVEQWTDIHGAWLGRLAHDSLAYQGISIVDLTPDDIDDLLFGLQRAQVDTRPGSAATAVDALRRLLTWANADAHVLAVLTDACATQLAGVFGEDIGDRRLSRAERRRGLKPKKNTKRR